MWVLLWKDSYKENTQQMVSISTEMAQSKILVVSNINLKKKSLRKKILTTLETLQLVNPTRFISIYAWR